MISYRYVRASQPSHGSRSTQLWCNICNEPCASNEALREHYRQRHPEAAANLEPQSGASTTPEHGKN
jgi:hypothetical protein